MQAMMHTYSRLPQLLDLCLQTDIYSTHWQRREQIAVADVKRGHTPRWLVSGRTSHGLAAVWRVWRIDELTERTDFLRSFRSLSPRSIVALSRRCPVPSVVREASSTSAIQISPSAATYSIATTRVPLRNELVPAYRSSSLDDVRPRTLIPCPRARIFRFSCSRHATSFNCDTAIGAQIAWRTPTQERLLRRSSISKSQNRTVCQKRRSRAFATSTARMVC